jgi:hypothetical protein
VAYDHETNTYISPRLARRRKRARAALWAVLTVVVLVGVGAAAALMGGGDDSGDRRGGAADDGTTTLAPGATTTLAPGATTTAPAAPTTTAKGKRGAATTLPPLPPPKPFKITASTGVNVREGPGTTYKVIGTVQTGVEVLVVCSIDGESVDSPVGPSTKWVRVTFNTEGGDTLTGYVSAPYVALGPALNDPAVVGLCPNV